MKKVKFRFLFYKAKFGDGHLVDDGISFWTGLFNLGTGPYSHIEVWKPSKVGLFDDSVIWHGKPITFFGKCFTSTMRDDDNGTVIRDASKVLKHPERWDYCEVELLEYRFNHGWEWATYAAKHNRGYDKLCIADFFNPLRWILPIHSKLKNICSEACHMFGYLCSIFFNIKNRPSPRRIARRLMKLGYKIEPLVKEN